MSQDGVLRNYLHPFCFVFSHLMQLSRSFTFNAEVFQKGRGLENLSKIGLVMLESAARLLEAWVQIRSAPMSGEVTPA